MDPSSLTPTARRAIARILEDPIFEVVPLPGATEQARRYLPPDARVSVTASPRRPIENTIAVAEALAEMGFRVTPHVAARMVRDADHLAGLLDRIYRSGIRAVFVVGGDATDAGAFSDGLSLIDAMAAVGQSLDIGVPCYPEGHPVISDDVLMKALIDKQSHARWMTSQICFDGGRVSDWARTARGAGVTLPLVIGLPGAVDRTKLLGISARIGVGQSLSFLRKNTGLVSAFVRPGGFDPGQLLADLGEDLNDPELGVTGCHLYTFNQCQATEEWRRNLLESLTGSGG